ncbi:MAG: BrnT family toxin [Gallionella sp.]|nr:BrnT family toxin [Gallionella sp.]
MTGIIDVYTIISLKTKWVWDEVKRRENLQKHGFDFTDANEVLDSRYRMDVHVVRGGEARIQSFSYALGLLAVLAVVHTERGGATRVISFRPASNKEREVYDVWLENEYDEP